MSDAEQFAAALAAAWELPSFDEALAAAGATLHPDVVLRQPLTRQGRGFARFERQMRGLALIFTDLWLRVVGWEADGDHVAVRFEITGSLGRRRLRVRACDRFVLDGAVARERRTTMDTWALVGPVLATPRVWPRALAVYVRMLL